MDELISRQQAIEVVQNRHMMLNKEKVLLINDLEKLPSAQPEQSIAEWQKDFREYINMLNIPRDDYKGIMEYINEVPSAQPVQCEDAVSRAKLLSAFPYDDEPTVTKCSLRMTINHLPSVTPKQRTGKWSIKEGELAFWDVCSECKKMVMHKAPFYNFCPNCGAKMEVTT